MQVREITSHIESFAPLSYQESYDNAGLQIGHPDQEVRGVLICIDITDEVIEEAIRLDTNLIISHHPLIFSGLKKLTGSNYTERLVIEAIRQNLSIYSAHTNLDAVHTGVNHKISEKLGLKNTAILVPKVDHLRKLVFFIPADHADTVRQEIFKAPSGVSNCLPFWIPLRKVDTPINCAAARLGGRWNSASGLSTAMISPSSRSASRSDIAIASPRS